MILVVLTGWTVQVAGKPTLEVGVRVSFGVVQAVRVNRTVSKVEKNICCFKIYRLTEGIMFLFQILRSCSGVISLYKKN